MRCRSIFVVGSLFVLVGACSATESSPASSGDGDGDGDSATGGSNNAPGDGDTIGTRCVLDESLPSFSGHSLEETTLGLGAPECGNNICIVNHTQGRLGCPYGQTQEDLTLPVDDPKRCKTPDGEAVTAPVQPQLVERRADDNIYCSCRCDGAQEDAPFCECPSGYECQPFIPALGLRNDDAGSYCLKEGTLYDSGAFGRATCDRDLQNCE